MRLMLVAIGLAVPASFAAAQGHQADSHRIVVQPDQITWSPAPPSVPKGAKAAVLEGDPRQEGPFTMRLSLPDGYRIPPHTHPAIERLTILEGTFQIGMGKKFRESALKSLPAGSFTMMQPETPHFVRAKGTTVVQLNGVGPWKLNYIDPADDPRQQTPTP